MFLISFIVRTRVSQIEFVAEWISQCFFKKVYKNWYSKDFGSSPTSHAYDILSLTKTYVTRLNAVKSTDIFPLTPFILYKSNIILTATNSQQQVLLQQFFSQKKLIHEFFTEAEVAND